MIKFTQPINLDGSILIDELISAGVAIDFDKSPSVDEDGNLWLDIAKADEAKAKAVVDKHDFEVNHKAQALLEKAKSEAKDALLNRLGITAEEAKLLLG